ncbi:MAG TPA: hypothetical protein VN864_01585 [Thermoplasmata archaeon]|nr:hypothetical protein [Thermoplasmata archaeon]
MGQQAAPVEQQAQQGQHRSQSQQAHANPAEPRTSGPGAIIGAPEELPVQEGWRHAGPGRGRPR